MCLGAFFSLEEGSTTVEGANPSDGPAWIIGDTFLKNVYSIFRYDNPRAVGFAQLSEIAKGLSDYTVQTVNASTDTSGTRATVSNQMLLGSVAMALIVGIAADALV